MMTEAFRMICLILSMHLISCAIAIITKQPIIKKQKGMHMPAIVLLLSIFLLYGSIAGIGYRRGATLQDMKHMPASDFTDRAFSLSGLHTERKGKNITCPCLIVYEKFSCKDCLEILPAMKKDMDGAGLPVYYISTETDLGKSLLERYPVENVPMLLYLEGENVSVRYCDPCRTEDDGTISYDRENVERFLKTWTEPIS